MLRFDILTLFPDMFMGPFDESIINRATRKKLIEIKVHNLRDHTHDVHRTVDDTPFGGGPGMILKAEPLFEAMSTISSDNSDQTKVCLLYTSPSPRDRSLSRMPSSA